MKHFFYSKLAITNLKNNRQTYVPYLLTSALSVMMFYMIDALNRDKSIKQVTLHYILNYSTVIIGFFAIILLFYTNSFLIKRRKKELGVYHILGMGKLHIAKMMALEVLMTAAISIGSGLILGISFGKLMYLILLKILHSGNDMHFAISFPSIAYSILLFGIIFFLTFAYNLLQIRLANPIDLLHGGQVGEKEPKTKWFLALIGVITLGIGYAIALTTTSPLEALFKFFLAVVCVIIGTYALFTVGSIVILKGLKKKKSYYYHPNHFTAVSGMLYRMKQNAVGLANICILSTMVLVMISTTVSLYIGMEDILNTRFPHAVSIMADQKESTAVQKIIDESCKTYGTKVESGISYRSIEHTMINHGNTFAPILGNQDYSAQNTVSVTMLPLSDYNKMNGTSLNLKENEVLLYRTDASYKKHTIVIVDKTYHVVKELSSMKVEPKNHSSILSHYYIVFSDIHPVSSYLSSFVKKQANIEDSSLKQVYVRFSFNLKGSEASIRSCLNHMKKQCDAADNILFESRELSKQSFYELYGGLFFMGIYLGIMFLIATVLIIYYKQISEGYDDRERYQIMQKVGMSKQEVRRSIKSQVLSVFFLPLIVATIHIAVAFKVIVKLLGALNLTNVMLFAICTIATVLLFGIFYAIVYAITAREYYRIVN